MRYRISVDDNPAEIFCRAGESVLMALQRAGRHDLIRIGCRSGGCGVCRVQVLAGRYVTGAMSAAEITPDCRASGVVLACRLQPETDLCLRTLGKRPPATGLAAAATRAPVSRLRAAASTSSSPSPDQT